MAQSKDDFDDLADGVEALSLDSNQDEKTNETPSRLNEIIRQYGQYTLEEFVSLGPKCDYYIESLSKYGTVSLQSLGTLINRGPNKRKNDGPDPCSHDPQRLRLPDPDLEPVLHDFDLDSLEKFWKVLENVAEAVVEQPPLPRQPVVTQQQSTACQPAVIPHSIAVTAPYYPVGPITAQRNRSGPNDLNKPTTQQQAPIPNCNNIPPENYPPYFGINDPLIVTQNQLVANIPPGMHQPVINIPQVMHHSVINNPPGVYDNSTNWTQHGVNSRNRTPTAAAGTPDPRNRQQPQEESGMDRNSNDKGSSLAFVQRPNSGNKKNESQTKTPNATLTFVPDRNKFNYNSHLKDDDKINEKISEFESKSLNELLDVDKEGDTIFHSTILNGEDDDDTLAAVYILCKMFKQMGKRDFIDKANEIGQTPLCIAVILRLHHVVKLLLDFNADPNVSFTSGDKQMRPIHKCVSKADNSYSNVLEVLLQNEKTDINSKNSDGYTALHIFVMLKLNIDSSLLKLLLNYNAMATIMANSGENALQMALKKKNIEHIRLLLYKSPNVKALINQKDGAGNTSLHILAGLDLPLSDHKELIEEMLAMGANKNAKNRTNEFPYSVVKKNKRENSQIEKLLRNNNSKDQTTPRNRNLSQGSTGMTPSPGSSSFSSQPSPDPEESAPLGPLPNVICLVEEERPNQSGHQIHSFENFQGNFIASPYGGFENYGDYGVQNFAHIPISHENSGHHNNAQWMYDQNPQFQYVPTGGTVFP